MRQILLVYILLALTGCATSGYRKYYTDQTGGRDLSQSAVIIPTDEPRLVLGTDPQKMSQSMAEEGYLLLGYSSFIGPMEDQANAINFARTLSAEVVVVYSSFSSTFSGSIPITTPTSQTSYSTGTATAYGSNGAWANASGSGTTTTYGTQTSYIPYSVDRYNQAAQFWIKAKPPVFGAHVSDLTEGNRRELASNRGVEIAFVIKGSPAFHADFMKGDIIRKINHQDVSLAKDFYELMPTLSGKTVQVEGVRDGKPFKKTVTLNEKSL